MNNQAIGTVGVFTITFFLLVLRHILLSISRPNRNRHLRPMKPSENFETIPGTSRKNSWPAWPAPSDTIASGHLGGATRAGAAHGKESQRSAANAVRDR
jgi:hypothetical protein